MLFFFFGGGGGCVGGWEGYQELPTRDFNVLRSCLLDEMCVLLGMAYYMNFLW